MHKTNVARSILSLFLEILWVYKLCGLSIQYFIQIPSYLAKFFHGCWNTLQIASANNHSSYLFTKCILSPLPWNCNRDCAWHNIFIESWYFIFCFCYYAKYQICKGAQLVKYVNGNWVKFSEVPWYLIQEKLQAVHYALWRNGLLWYARSLRLFSVKNVHGFAWFAFTVCSSQPALQLHIFTWFFALSQLCVVNLKEGTFWNL